jgi:hypothetical protein
MRTEAPLDVTCINFVITGLHFLDAMFDSMSVSCTRGGRFARGTADVAMAPQSRTL